MYTHKKQKTISKRQAFLIEKYIEDARQDEKHVPDLLEAIMKGSGLVKEELRLILYKLSQFRSKSLKSGFALLRCPGKSRIVPT